MSGPRLHPEQARDLLERDAAPAWRRLAERLQAFEALYESELVHADGKRESGTRRVLRRGSSCLCETREASDDSTIVLCWHDGLGYMLHRARAEQPWILAAVEREGHDGPFSKHVADECGFFEGCYSASPGRGMLEAISDPTFEILGAEWATESVLRLRYRWPYPYEAETNQVVSTEHSSEFEVAQDWVVLRRESHVVMVDGSVRHGSMATAYDFDGGPAPILRSCEITGSGIWIGSKVTHFVFRSAHDAEFSPANYGFDENSGPFAPGGAVGALEHAIADAVARQVTAVEVPIRNPEDRTWRLIGADHVCREGVCVEAQGLPLEIPPRSERALSLKLTINGSGPFRREFVVYCQGGPSGQLAIVLHGAAR